MKSVSSFSPAGAESALRTIARNESTTTMAGFDRLELLDDGVEHLAHPTRRAPARPRWTKRTEPSPILAASKKAYCCW